jgi:GWxTD domain-containing protein
VGVLQTCAVQWGLALVLPLSGALPAGRDTVSVRVAQERIRALQDRLQSTDSDSLRYELALAFRDAGTIEDRYRALKLFDAIRPAFENEPRYHWDRAILFEKCGRPSNAVSSLLEVVKLTPADVPARVEIARLRLKELLYRYDLGGTAPVLQELQEALTLDPHCRDALFLMALTDHLATWAPGSNVAELTVAGKACLDSILVQDPRDVSALFLLGVHCLDLGQTVEAEHHFLDGLAASPEETQTAFASIRWTAGPAALGHLKSLDAKDGALFDQAFWIQDDPTPLTRLNENQLEIWKRLALAEFLFGTPGKHGWDTDPGEAFVRYGPPLRSFFDPGSITGGGPDPSALDTARFKFNLKFIHPTWRWEYDFHGLQFSLAFEDLTLLGDFVKSEPTAMTVQVLRERTPVVFQEAPAGEIQNLYVAAAGVAGPGGKVHESLYVGLPPWKKPNGDDWFLDSRLEMVLRDSTHAEVGRSAQHPTAENLYRPLPGAEMLLFAGAYDLAPGRYTLTAYVEDGDTKEHGVFTRPIEVQDYTRASLLRLSDLEVGFRTAPGVTGPKHTKLGQTYIPNPMGWVGDLRNLEIFFEVYGLAAEAGQVRFSTRYTVLPRSYVLGYEYFVRQGKAAPENLVAYAAKGLSIGGVVLGRDNYSDTEFPATSPPARERGMPRAIVLDLGNLVPGEYVLIVTVTDAVSGQEASARNLFQVLTDSAMRDLLDYRK